MDADAIRLGNARKKREKGKKRKRQPNAFERKNVKAVPLPTLMQTIMSFAKPARGMHSLQ